MDEGVDREQLDGGDPKTGQMVDDDGVGQTGIGAADLLWDLRMAHRDPAHMGLVHHGLVERDPGMAVVPPIEEGAHHHRSRYRRCRVRVVRLVWVIELVGEHRRSPGDGSVDRLRVGIEQQLGRVGSLTATGFPWAVDPEAVPLPGDDLGKVTMPDEAIALGELDPGFGAIVGEETELHRVSNFRKDRDICPSAVECSAERIRLAWPDLHHPSPMGPTG